MINPVLSPFKMWFLNSYHHLCYTDWGECSSHLFLFVFFGKNLRNTPAHTFFRPNHHQQFLPRQYVKFQDRMNLIHCETSWLNFVLNSWFEFVCWNWMSARALLHRGDLSIRHNVPVWTDGTLSSHHHKPGFFWKCWQVKHFIYLKSVLHWASHAWRDH